MEIYISDIAKLFSPFKNEQLEKIKQKNFSTDIKLNDFEIEEILFDYEIENIPFNNTRKGYTTKGNICETQIIKKLKAEKIPIYNIQKYRNFTFKNIKVIGRIDGIIDYENTRMVLEIKSRCIGMQRPYMSDLIQLILYMELFHLEKGLLVIEKEGFLKGYVLQYNEELVDRILKDIVDMFY